MGAKRTSAMCAAMRKTAEVRAMVVVAARWRRLARRIHAMAGPMAKAKAASAAGRRRAAKDGAGEVEEVRHGERVVADAAMGEEVADVGDEGEMARGPEAVGEGDGDGEADDGEGGVGEGDPAAGGFVFGVGCLRRGRGRRR